MNKKELIASIAEKGNLNKKDAELALKATLETIQDEVANGEKVQLVGFGTFEPRERSARTGRNPKTGAEIQIPATVVPVFKAGKEFKERVAK